MNISSVLLKDLAAKLNPKWRAAITRATLLTTLEASWQEAEISAAEFVFDMSLLQSGVDEHQTDKFTISLGHLLFWIKTTNSLTDLVYPSETLPLCAHLTHRVHLVCSQDPECIPAMARVLCERGIMLDERLLGANIAIFLRRSMDNGECITNAIAKGHYGLLSLVAELGEESRTRVLRLLAIDKNFYALVKACLEPSAPSEFSAMVHRKPPSLTEWAAVAHSSRYAAKLLRMLAKHGFKASTSQIGWASSSDSQQISSSLVFLAANQFFVFVDDRNDVDYFLQILRCVGSVAGYGVSNAHEDALIRDFTSALLHVVHGYAKIHWVPGSSKGVNAGGLVDEQIAENNPHLRAFLDSCIDTTIETGTHATEQYAMQRSISRPLLIRKAFKGLDRTELYCNYGSRLNYADILINFLMAARVEPNKALFSPSGYRSPQLPWTPKRTLLHCLPMAYASSYLARHQARLMSEAIDKGISIPPQSSLGGGISNSPEDKTELWPMGQNSSPAALDFSDSLYKDSCPVVFANSLGGANSDSGLADDQISTEDSQGVSLCGAAGGPEHGDMSTDPGNSTLLLDDLGTEPSDIYADMPRRRRSTNSDGAKANRHDAFPIQAEIAARAAANNRSMDVSTPAAAIPEDRNLFQRVRTRMGSL